MYRGGQLGGVAIATAPLQNVMTRSTPALQGRMHEEMEVRTWPSEDDRFHSNGDLDATRGAVIGVALGAICWSLMGAFLYFIVF